METAKEKAANIAASAKSGMEKTKAILEEKVFIYIVKSFYNSVDCKILL